MFTFNLNTVYVYHKPNFYNSPQYTLFVFSFYQYSNLFSVAQLKQ